MFRLTPLIFVLSFLSVTFSHVCNRTALSSIDASVRRFKNERAETYKNHDFHLLDDYTKIDVVRANITELCESLIISFPNLEVLSLINVNLSVIQPNAFDKVPKLHTLSLSVNHIEEIKQDAFNNIPNLKILFLSKNRINYIQEEAFRNLPNLEAVHLDRNRLAQVSGNWFENRNNLKLLDFSFNALRSIKSDAFSSIKHGNPVKIKLSQNIISEFDPSALNELGPVNLNLEHNELDKLEDIFHITKADSKLNFNYNNIGCIDDLVVVELRTSTKSLYVKKNPLDCDCLDKIKDLLGYEVNGKGEFEYDSKFPCFFGPGPILIE